MASRGGEFDLRPLFESECLHSLSSHFYSFAFCRFTMTNGGFENTDPMASSMTRSSQNKQSCGLGQNQDGHLAGIDTVRLM